MDGCSEVDECVSIRMKKEQIHDVNMVRLELWLQFGGQKDVGEIYARESTKVFA